MMFFTEPIPGTIYLWENKEEIEQLIEKKNAKV